MLYFTKHNSTTKNPVSELNVTMLTEPFTVLPPGSHLDLKGLSFLYFTPKNPLKFQNILQSKVSKFLFGTRFERAPWFIASPRVL